tara:strand:- start:602 stop:1216 length:615 start_codon:yes stop_codon:yes gene_type:complete
MTNERINKLLKKKITKTPTKKSKRIDYAKMDRKKRAKIMTSPIRRLAYLNEFYNASQSELIERILLTKTKTIHSQLIANMRVLVRDKLLKATIKEQINFNDRLEWAFVRINLWTRKNIYIREVKGFYIVYDVNEKEKRSDVIGKTEKNVKMYFNKVAEISTGDKAKLRARTNILLKEEMLEKMLHPVKFDKEKSIGKTFEEDKE